MLRRIKPQQARRRAGLSLVETLVVLALMSSISAFTIVLYKTAMGDFEQANAKMSLNRYARNASMKVSEILATASARRPFTPQPDALYWPNDFTSETYFVDFLSSANYIRNGTNECTYAFDNGTVAPGGGYTLLFRYRLGWTETGFANIPRNSIYLERLDLDQASSATPTQMLNTYRQVIAPNIARCTFQKTSSIALQMRIAIYNYDPVTGRSLDGQVMRTMTGKRRKDVTDASADGIKRYELVTSVPLPSVSINK